MMLKVMVKMMFLLVKKFSPVKYRLALGIKSLFLTLVNLNLWQLKINNGLET